MFVDATTRGPREARGVALTFDDGPHPVHTRAVLDALDVKRAKATFFLIGKKAEKHPDVVKEILTRGHTVGLHSYAHDRLMALRTARRVRADLVTGIRVLEKITGSRPVLFRPPIGHTNPSIARIAEELDLAVVGWTVSGLDGVASAKSEHVTARVCRRMRNGSILALHDAAERDDHQPACLEALPAILAAIAERGLEVTPIERWVEPRAKGA
jgi:peptidoglycan/xylan/chitin deacetylase (PgdA/CDA1 family)